MSSIALSSPGTVTTACGEISYREAGVGDALVLLHGIGSGSASWQAQLAALADRFRVIAWDAPGYGDSDRLAPAAPDAADYAAALASFLNALAIANCHLVGHSLGALMACAFAQRWPARVRSLFIADPAAGYAKAAPEQRAERKAARLDLLERLGPAGMAAERSAVLLSDDAPQSAKDRVREIMARVRPDGYRQAVAMLLDADIHADARRIALPVQVVCGGADVVTPPAGCREVAESFPDGRFELLAGLGHNSYIEGPDAFNAALIDHIRSRGR